MRLAVAMWPYGEARWGERQGVDYIEALLDRQVSVPDELRAWAMTASATMGGNAGEARRSIPRASEAVAAFRRLGDERGLGKALAALGQALGNQGRLDEADRVLAEGLTIARRLDDLQLIGHFLDRTSYIACRRNEYARAAAINREELAVAVALGSRRAEATAQRHLAVALQHLGASDDAAALCNRALEIWSELDDPAAVAHVRTTLADIARLDGDLDGAAHLYDTALVDLQAIGDRRCTASTYKNLAAIAAERGETRQAAALYLDGLALRHELGDEAGLAEVLEGLAAVDAHDGRMDDAVTLVAAAGALRRRTGSAASNAEASVAGRILDAGRQRLGDRYDVAFRRGQEMSASDVAEFAVSTGDLPLRNRLARASGP
jgi:tetratricopeptide (TPR) repeat protein